MAENYEGTNETDVEKNQELQHVCKFENDDNELFFDSHEYPYSQRTGKDDGIRSVQEIRDISEEIESSHAFSDSIYSDEENQCINRKSRNEIKPAFGVYESSDECDQKIKGKTEHQNLGTIYRMANQIGIQVDEQDALNIGKDVEKSEASLQSSQSKKETVLERSDSCTDLCPKHSDEIIKYICNSCKNVACQVCITLEHKNCNSCEFIPTFIKNAYIEKECERFENEMDQLKKRLKHSKTKSNSNITSCENMRVQAKEDLKKHRDEINKRFDCLEKDLERKTLQMENDDQEKMQLLNLYEGNLGKLEQDYYQRKHAGNKTAVFTKVKVSMDDIDEMKKKIEKLETDNTVRRYIYTPSKHVEDVSDIGNLEEVISSIERKVTFIKLINMKAETDEKSCKISGLEFVSEHHLIAVDYGNSSVKVVDICKEELLTVLPMTSSPAFDVTIVCNQPKKSKLDESNVEIALTLPEENKIRFMQFSLSSLAFSVIHDIQTNGQCRSIVYHKNKLFITFPKKGKIEIVDMGGQLLKRITTETVGRLFQPQFVTIDTGMSTIFVSDEENHSVTSMTLDGEIKNSYTHHDLVSPRGLCVTRTGAVFVCALASQTVHHQSDSCKAISCMRVATEAHPVPYPFSIAYNDRHNILVVGQFTGDCIKTYKLE